MHGFVLREVSPKSSGIQSHPVKSSTRLTWQVTWGLQTVESPGHSGTERRDHLHLHPLDPSDLLSVAPRYEERRLARPLGGLLKAK